MGDAVATDGLLNSLPEYGNAHPESGDIQKAGGLVKVHAYRDITTETGHIAKGTVGYVTSSWINKVIAGRCACKGSPNWFKVI